MIDRSSVLAETPVRDCPGASACHIEPLVVVQSIDDWNRGEPSPSWAAWGARSPQESSARSPGVAVRG